MELRPPWESTRAFSCALNAFASILRCLSFSNSYSKSPKASDWSSGLNVGLFCSGKPANSPNPSPGLGLKSPAPDGSNLFIWPGPTFSNSFGTLGPKLSPRTWTRSMPDKSTSHSLIDPSFNPETSAESELSNLLIDSPVSNPKSTKLGIKLLKSWLTSSPNVSGNELSGSRLSKYSSVAEGNLFKLCIAGFFPAPKMVSKNDVSAMMDLFYCAPW